MQGRACLPRSQAPGHRQSTFATHHRRPSSNDKRSSSGPLREDDFGSANVTRRNLNMCLNLRFPGTSALARSFNLESILAGSGTTCWPNCVCWQQRCYFVRYGYATDHVPLRRTENCMTASSDAVHKLQIFVCARNWLVSHQALKRGFQNAPARSLSTQADQVFLSRDALWLRLLIVD